MKRNLDGLMFHVKRGNKIEEVCYSDLTDDEMQEVLKDKDKAWLEAACFHLGVRLQVMGDLLDTYFGNSNTISE